MLLGVGTFTLYWLLIVLSYSYFVVDVCYGLLDVLLVYCYAWLLFVLICIFPGSSLCAMSLTVYG